VKEDEIEVKVEVILFYRGEPIIDSSLAEVLRLIKEKGSILAACRSLGLAYSRVWERIFKVEKILGVKLIEAKRGGRGGGGATLTPYANRLLEIYSSAVEKVRPCASLLGRVPIAEKPPPELVIMGSHDPLLEHLIGILRSKGLSDVEVHWTGSLGGLASILLREADVVGIHLFDPETSTYNKPFIKKFMLEREVMYVKGYERELVFALKPSLNINSLDEVIGRLSSGELIIANRIKGSGTRLFLENVLRMKGVDVSKIKGFETEYRTHFDVARAIAMGKADVGLTLRYVAELYRLSSIHVAWEKFDYVIPLDRRSKRSIQLFLETLRKINELAPHFPGYRVSEEVGKVEPL